MRGISFQGVPIGTAISTIALVLFGGGIYWIWRMFRTFLGWWALRLHFLGMEDAKLKYYGIHEPNQERWFARLAGTCLLAATVCAVVTYYRFGPKEPAWPFVTSLFIAGYVALTTIFYLKRRNNRIAYSLDVGVDE